jgi:hypothetical protein
MEKCFAETCGGAERGCLVFFSTVSVSERANRS